MPSKPSRSGSPRRCSSGLRPAPLAGRSKGRQSLIRAVFGATITARAAATTGPFYSQHQRAALRRGRLMTTTTESNVVDTGKVKGRRSLRFETIDQAIDEANRLVMAERAGRLSHLGNWTLGQALGHLGGWTEFSYTGVPLKPPFFIRWILRLRKRKLLYSPMPAGVSIPGVAGGTLATDRVSLDEGYDRFQRAMLCLKREAPTARSPIFGQMTHDESIALSLRHAELHLSFFVAEPA